MGQQQISGQFPGGGIAITGLDAPLTVFDGIGTPAVSSWTRGGSVWAPIPISIPLGDVWAIVSWSIVFTGLCINAGPGAFGKCGRVEAALLRGGVTVAPQTIPMQQFPGDAISKAVLWDGVNDPIFPFVPASGPAVLIPLRTDIVLQTPQNLPAGAALSVGVNITPSLVKVNGAGNIAMICLVGVQYSVNFDDGRPLRSGWGG